jgi:hypothetical protein
MRRWDFPEIASNFVDGDLAIVKIYNLALNSGEISTNFDENKNRFGL